MRRRDRWVVGAALTCAVALCACWIVPMGLDMYGTMHGTSAWMMTTRWDALHLALLFLMWAIMMAGMMLPSVAPALFLYGSVVRASPQGAHARAWVNLFAAGYLLVWTGFSLAATVLQRLLAGALVLSPMMDLRDRRLGGWLLVLAGLYQLTPAKRACLRFCRSPAEFLVRHWRNGPAGAMYLGVLNGLFCLGCCWALMLLLFVGGVMNLLWIGGLTVYVLLEKFVPFGDAGGRAAGLLAAAVGLALVL